MQEESQTNLIINYLPQTLTDDEFKSMFISIGPVKNCKIVRDKNTHYSYGFGFVDYYNPTDATQAIQTLNGLQLQNKRIKVAYSRNKENVKNANLYVRNIPRAMTQGDLEKFFSECGNIVNCRILTDQATGHSKGVGFVLFDTHDQAQEAINRLNGKVPPMGTEALNIKFAEENAGKARQPPVMVINPGGWGGGYNQGAYSGPMRQSRFNMRYNPMGGTPSSGLSVNEEGYVLFVYNIGPHCDERALWQLFAPFGSIQKVNVMKDHQKNQGKGFGFVTMLNYHEAMTAINSLNGYSYFGNKTLQVSFKTPTGRMGMGM